MLAQRFAKSANVGSSSVRDQGAAAGTRQSDRRRMPWSSSSYLVDPASSHMLVSKIKPCMSKYKHLYTVKLRTAHYISDYFFDGTSLHG